MVMSYGLLPLFVLVYVTKSVYSTISFTINPGCDLEQCKKLDYPAVFYGSQTIDNDTIHVLYSSFDELTISIIQTEAGHAPDINYQALFNRNYSNAITFKDAIQLNSFSLILRRLMKFNDQNNTGTLDRDDNSTESYWLSQLTTNQSRQDANISQPSFQLPLESLNGLLTVDINYPGEPMRDLQFPRLSTLSKSYFLNIALQADNYSLPNTRFALEFYVIQLGVEGTRFSSSRFIDDQYTPGIFNVCQIKSLSSLYPSSILWKPVVYQSMERSVGKTTLMNIYGLQNNISLVQTIDQGIFNSFYTKPYVSAFNISLGRPNDGFFAKTNYTFIQFTAGLDILEVESMKKFVTTALLVSLALPSLVAFIALMLIIKRQCEKENVSSYQIIED